MEAILEEWTGILVIARRVSQTWRRKAIVGVTVVALIDIGSPSGVL
jgi:hypothetical protein